MRHLWCLSLLVLPTFAVAENPPVRVRPEGQKSDDARLGPARTLNLCTATPQGGALSTVPCPDATPAVAANSAGQGLNQSLIGAGYTVPTRLTGGYTAKWTRADLQNAWLGNSNLPSAAALNMHYDQYRGLPAYGNATLQITLKMNLVLITPIISQVTANNVVLTATAIYRTEY